MDPWFAVPAYVVLAGVSLGLAHIVLTRWGR